MKISVIIPVYNEFRTFNQGLERVRQAPLPQGCSKEIVVVDDGSTDGTTEMLGKHTREGVVVGHHSARNYERAPPSAPASCWRPATSC
jgi:glycosyltransferase involved in cell wall biosynthesis